MYIYIYLVLLQGFNCCVFISSIVLVGCNTSLVIHPPISLIGILKILKDKIKQERGKQKWVGGKTLLAVLVSRLFTCTDSIHNCTSLCNTSKQQK